MGRLHAVAVLHRPRRPGAGGGRPARAARGVRRARLGAEEIPDPQDPATFRPVLLDWSEPRHARARELLDWYRSLIALRRARPELTDPVLPDVVEFDEGGRWIVVHRGGLRVVANLGASPVRVPLDVGRILLSTPGVTLGLELPGLSFAVAE